jgi:hypothetical protein
MSMHRQGVFSRRLMEEVAGSSIAGRDLCHATRLAYSQTAPLEKRPVHRFEDSRVGDVASTPESGWDFPFG